MKYNLILENWKQFLQEADMATSTQGEQMALPFTDLKEKPSPAEEKENKIDLHVDAIEKNIKDVLLNAKQQGLTASDLRTKLISYLNQLQEAKKKKKSGDRCTRIAKRKYDVWPSAYASGAVVKCRQGKIWKGISENATDEEIDDALLLEEIEVIEEKQNNQLNERCWKGYTQKGMKTMFGKRYPNCVKVTKESVDVEETNTLEEKWSGKYKSSIDCKNPKGFSQKAHCQGRKKNEELELDDELVEEAKKKAYKPNFSKEKEQGLHGWFARNNGKGWVNCRTGGPCGRDSTDSGGKYPACRPTKAQCKSAGKGPLRKKTSSKPISWTKKKKKD